MISLATILASLFFIITTAVIDSNHINKGEHIKSHNSRFLQRLSFFLMIAQFNYFLAIAAALLFATTFDAVLNIMIGKPIFYLGNTAKWDRFLRRKPIIHLTVKIVSLVGSGLLFWYA
jgi:hypothetical protein